MKQGLSLRVSQHLALTPQLQQSIRLLQLSTLELSQEVEQMLDDNPFLELNAEEAPREEFGLPQVDTPVRRDDLEAESASSSIASNDQATLGSDQNESEVAVPESWEGDGTTEVLPDDSEWGGDAPARKNNLGDDDERADASELARSQESLTTFLHRQALALRLSEVDRAALRFLIESLNDDGYLEDSLASLAAGLAGDDLEQAEELEHRFSMALGLLQSLEPTGVGARHLGECLSLQLKARLARLAGRCDRRHRTAHLRTTHGAAGAARHQAPDAAVRRHRGRRARGHRPDRAAGAQAGPALSSTSSATSSSPTSS
jgi:RNA polymerase sigma-54 factor